MEFEYRDYYEPDAYEMFMNEFTEKIRTAMTEEAKKLVEAQQAESEMLREKVRTLETALYDARIELGKPKRERAEVERQVRRERLSELMKDMTVTAWRPVTAYLDLPKCEKCNAQRQIPFKFPSGKDGYEQCECSIRKPYRRSEKFVVTEFRIDDRDKGNMIVFYDIVPSSRENGDEYGRLTQVFKGYSDDEQDFSKIVLREAVFKEESRCQEYCDWHNSEYCHDAISKPIGPSNN